MGVSAIAKGIMNAKLRGGGVYLNPGKGEILILEAKMIETEESGAVFISNFVVDKCEGFAGIKDETGKDKPAGNPVGSIAGVACKIEDGDKYKREYAFEDMTRYLCAALDEEPDEVCKNLEALLGLNDKGVTDPTKPQPMRGIRVGYVTKEIKTNPKGQGAVKKALTKVDFFKLPQTPEEQKAERAALDAKFPAK